MPNQSKSLKTYSRYKSIFTTPASQGGDIVSNALPRTFADLDLYPHDPGSPYKKDGSACHKKAKHSKLVHFCDEIVTLNAHTQNGCMRGVSCGSDGSRSRDPAFPTGYFLPSLTCTANQLKKAVEEKPEFYKSSFLSQIPKNELKMSDSENNLQIDLDRMSSEDKSAAEKEINELNSRPKAPPPKPSTPKSHSKPEAPEDSSLISEDDGEETAPRRGGLFSASDEEHGRVTTTDPTLLPPTIGDWSKEVEIGETESAFNYSSSISINSVDPNNSINFVFGTYSFLKPKPNNAIIRTKSPDTSDLKECKSSEGEVKVNSESDLFSLAISRKNNRLLRRQPTLGYRKFRRDRRIRNIKYKILCKKRSRLINYQRETLAFNNLIKALTEFLSPSLPVYPLDKVDIKTPFKVDHDITLNVPKKIAEKETLPPLGDDEIQAIYERNMRKAEEEIKSRQLQEQKRLDAAKGISPPTSVVRAIFHLSMEQAKVKDEEEERKKKLERQKKNINLVCGSLNLPSPVPPKNPFVGSSTYASVASTSDNKTEVGPTASTPMDKKEVVTVEDVSSWHVYAESEEYENGQFSHSAYIDLKNNLKANIKSYINTISLNKLPISVAGHSFEYSFTNNMAVLTPNDPKHLSLYKAILESTTTEFKGVTGRYKAVKPEGEPETALTKPNTEKLLLRLHDVVARNCTDSDIIACIKENYMQPNGIEDSDWRILEHKVKKDGKLRTVKAIYPSGKYGLAHMVAVEAKAKLYDLVSSERSKEAERLGVTDKAFGKNLIPWAIHGFGEDLTAEPATFHPSDFTYIPNDQQPREMKRIKVLECDDEAAVSEDGNGNISIEEAPIRSMAYTDRLFKGKDGKGKGFYNAKGGKQSADSDSDQEETSYEATVIVPRPRGSLRARKIQQALNNLQVAFTMRSIKTQVFNSANTMLGQIPNSNPLPLLGTQQQARGEGVGRPGQGEGQVREAQGPEGRRGRGDRQEGLQGLLEEEEDEQGQAVGRPSQKDVQKEITILPNAAINGDNKYANLLTKTLNHCLDSDFAFLSSKPSLPTGISADSYLKGLVRSIRKSSAISPHRSKSSRHKPCKKDRPKYNKTLLHIGIRHYLRNDHPTRPRYNPLKLSMEEPEVFFQSTL